MRRRAGGLVLTTIAIVAAACGHVSAPAAPPTPAEPPWLPGLGTHSRHVTDEPTAQRFFDQGLALVFAFNHDEAIRAFRAAAAHDPRCAMAHWGMALAAGPHINNVAMDPEHAEIASTAVQQATALAANAAPADRDLIAALRARYADPPPLDRQALDRAYADAMGRAYARHRDDADVAAVYAEALMDLQPWDLWEGTRPKGRTREILAVLERTLRHAPLHPLANHLYVHAVEASPYPEHGDAAADRLRALAPGLGHLVHMPSHVDVRRGRWAQAAAQNELAIESDRRYRALSPQQGFYQVYMLHNRHMLAFASIMRGRRETALAAARDMVAAMPAEFVREAAPMVDGYLATPIEVLMRFGRWEEVLAEPDFPDYLQLSRALRHYARAVALAALGRRPEAVAEQAAFAAARRDVPADRAFSNNPASALLAIADHLLAGELALAGGDVDAAVVALRAGVAAEDALRYDEPPDWIQPVRHTLGAALLRAGRPREAERIFLEDLRRLPENGWALYGLARSLAAQGRTAQAVAVQSRFTRVWDGADTPITSSCVCVPDV